MSADQSLVHVKDWAKAKQATLFKLSSSVYQAIFPDKSEIFMTSKHMSLLFVDKDRKKHHFIINSTEIQKNRSVNVRIEYFKKVLRRWIERDANGTLIGSTSKSKQLSPAVNHDLDI